MNSSRANPRPILAKATWTNDHKGIASGPLTLLRISTSCSPSAVPAVSRRKRDSRKKEIRPKGKGNGGKRVGKTAFASHSRRTCEYYPGDLAQKSPTTEHRFLVEAYRYRGRLLDPFACSPEIYSTRLMATINSPSS